MNRYQKDKILAIKLSRDDRNILLFSSVQFNSVQSFSLVQLIETPWTAPCQASLSVTNFRSLLKLISIKSVMPSNHLILLFPSPPAFNLSQHQGMFDKVFASGGQSIGFSFSISPSNEYSGLISFRMDWFYLLAIQELETTLKSCLQHHSSTASTL